MPQNTSDKIQDAIDAIITLIMAEKVFNTTLEGNVEQYQELKFAVLNKLDEMGVHLVEVNTWSELA